MTRFILNLLPIQAHVTHDLNAHLTMCMHQAPPAISLEYRPNLWYEVLQKLGGRVSQSCQIPESVLRVAPAGFQPAGF